jgi:hypothetical protein
VLIVRVDVTGVPVTTTVAGLNEHTGGIVTKGVIVAHDSVTPGVPGGLLYPLIGLRVMVPSPPLPAGTLLGTTAFSTAMVNCGVTARTVRVRASGAGCVPLDAVPVIVMVYPTVDVSPFVVIVAEALAGGVTVVGLTVQTGGSVVTCVDVTWQARSTVPLKPLTVPIVMFEDDVPPGATASGENGAACRVTFWANAADGKIRRAAHRHR